MHNKGTTGILIEGGSDCHIDNCEFRNLGTAVSIEGGENNRVTHSRFRNNKSNVRIRGGTKHAIVGNLFEGKQPLSRKDGLRAIRRLLSLSDKIPDREILASLDAVRLEHDEKRKQEAASKSTLGRWLIDHGTDVNTATNTLVTIAAAVAQWFK